MSTLYKITWEIDLEADSPRKAAETALKWLQEPGAECVMFTVQAHTENGTFTEPELIDLLEERFTVMLLRPDYATDNYGQDTFTETVSAPDADEAIAEVKSLCAIADDRDPDEYVQDLHVLAVMKGEVEFIQ